ncbi:unnamed protein product [Ectocarpus sp. 12 AP-2014]
MALHRSVSCPVSSRKVVRFVLVAATLDKEGGWAVVVAVALIHRIVSSAVVPLAFSAPIVSGCCHEDEPACCSAGDRLLLINIASMCSERSRVEDGTHSWRLCYVHECLRWAPCQKSQPTITPYDARRTTSSSCA